MNYSICVIGNESFLFPFLQFGFITYTPDDEASLREYLLDAIKQNFGIIYIEDVYCSQIKDIMDAYRESPIPIFVPIGESEQGESYSELLMKETMEKAIGMSIL